MNQDKVDTVAAYVADAQRSGFRGMLFGLASAGKDSRIERELANDVGLKAFIEHDFPGDPLKHDELLYCSTWGICAAKTVRHLPGMDGEAKIAFRLANYLNCDGSPPRADQVVSIGA